MKKLMLDLSNILKSEPGLKTNNVDRLLGTLQKRKGIQKINIKSSGNAAPRLQIHFNERHISARQIKHIAIQTGKKLNSTFGHLWIKMQKVWDQNHTRAITTLLKNFKGVIRVLVVPSGWIFLEFNSYITQESLLRGLIKKMNLVV